jgi:hypothetical protein
LTLHNHKKYHTICLLRTDNYKASSFTHTNRNINYNEHQEYNTIMKLVLPSLVLLQHQQCQDLGESHISLRSDKLTMLDDSMPVYITSLVESKEMDIAAPKY